MDRILSIGLCLAILTSVLVSPAYAVTIPNFPACTNPQGTIKVSYNDGTHGIPGDTNTYTGKDTVYTLSDTTNLQCFCADNGSGIETRWWKVSSLTQEEKDFLKNDKWIFIPDGSLWGLSASEYYAKNLSYACKSNDGGTGGGSTNSTTSSTGSVLGTTTIGKVLGLATTSGRGQSFFLIALGVTCLAVSLSVGSKNDTK